MRVLYTCRKIIIFFIQVVSRHYIIITKCPLIMYVRFYTRFIAITPLRRRRYRRRPLWWATIATAVDQRLPNAKRSAISSRRRVVVTRTEGVVAVNRRPDKVYSNSPITPSCRTNSNSTVS